MNWNKEDFHKFIINNEIIGFFEKPLKLKSGRMSYWYVNWRNVAEDAYLLDKLTDFLIAFVTELNLNPDCFYGVPEGGTKMGVLTQYKWAKEKNCKKGDFTISMGRAIPKEHGDPKDKFFLGVPRGNVVVLEDVLTTGGSLINTLKNLKELDLNIIAAIGLTNRSELRDDGKSVKDAIKELGINLYSLSDALDLLPIIYEKFQPGETVGKHIESYFQEYGIKEIKLV